MTIEVRNNVIIGIHLSSADNLNTTSNDYLKLTTRHIISKMTANVGLSRSVIIWVFGPHRHF